jgi:hypothetical protein
MIARVKCEWAALTSLLRVGLLVFVLGSGLDLLYHGSPAGWAPSLEAYVGPDGHRAHLVIMAGMLVIVLGLVAQGLAAGRQAGQAIQAGGKGVNLQSGEAQRQ